ncbi:hypothetical protein HPB50_013395 [Hyalomma asiaticum]|uniref:Uncharacterized protein n=1 Tax=Hyalomma asiaticum TaxID=266040 RepID=A0ACB7RJN0_HYAAI|nr:hypothetical protein HPB50_013395 [Hyalomma asiaticum]
MTERHTGAAIMSEFQRCLEEFSMAGKEMCAVNDAGAKVKRAASLAHTENHLASELEEIADSELNAAAQSLVSTADALEHDENDPIVDDGFENHDNAYSTASVTRGVTTVKLDTPTRWHSILAMLESLLANKARLGLVFGGEICV